MIRVICPLLLLLLLLTQSIRTQGKKLLRERLGGSGAPPSWRLTFIRRRSDGMDDFGDNNVYMQTPSQTEDAGLLQAKLREFDAALDEVCVYED